MQEIQGFIVLENGQPVKFELSDDMNVACVLPVSVFIDDESAIDAAMAHQGCYGTKTVFEIRHVTLTIGDVHKIVEYSEEEDDGE